MSGKGSVRVVALVALIGVLLALYFLRRPGEHAPQPPNGIVAEPSASSEDAALRIALRASPATQDRPRFRIAATVSPATPVWTAATVRDPSATHGSFAGRVLSRATGLPVAGASLMFVHDAQSTSIATQQDGSFRFEPSTDGAFELVRVGANGFEAFAPELGQSPITFVARAGIRIDRVTVYLAPHLEYTATAYDPSGSAVAGAELRVIDPAPPDLRAFVTDAHGETRFFAPDGALLEARNPRFFPVRVAIDAAAQASHRVVVRFRAAAEDAGTSHDGTLHLAGRVVDTHGAAVAGAVVRAQLEEPEGARVRERELHPRGVAVTAPDGTFRMTGLDPGSYVVTASAHGFASVDLESVAAGREDVTLQLATGASIRGVVRDTTDHPITAFTLLIARRLGTLQRGEQRSLAVFDTEGRYAIDDIAPGSYVLSAVAGSYGRATDADVVVPSPEVAADSSVQLDLTLPTGATIFGRITEPHAGAPIANARATLEELGPRDDTGGSVERVAVTGADGTFELTGLSPGRHSVLFSAADHNGRLLSNLRVDEGARAGPVNVELSPTAPGEEPHIELVGIGAVISARGDALTIEGLLPNGGAAQAGLQVGDVILSVDGADVHALGFASSVQQIRGPEGSTVQLAIRRGTDAGAFVVTVTRTRVQQS